VVRRALTPRTKLIVVTNLHNPSSVLTSETVLREIGDLARSVGAHVLVDEVYLDAVYDNTPRTAFHLGPEFIITNSLTKVYGLSGLRCGWILADPDLARAMWRLNDLFGVIPAHPAELLSVTAFENLSIIRDRARRIVEADRAIFAEFLLAQDSVSAPPTQYGTTAFLRLKGRDVDSFLECLRTDCETTAVPGRFFEMPDHFRIGMGVDTAMFREGIRRLARDLES
jgi:aspartate/methionine/tyrosine aminotransferase